MLFGTDDIRDEDVTMEHPNFMKMDHLFKIYTTYMLLEIEAKKRGMRIDLNQKQSKNKDPNMALKVQLCLYIGE